MLNINDVIKDSRNNQDDIKVDDMGTLIPIFDEQPPVYEIEFTDNEGRTLATVPLKKENMSLYWVASTETYFKTIK